MLCTQNEDIYERKNSRNTQKEELLAKKLEGKTVVIFDVLLATSTIAAALQQGAIEVIPVKTKKKRVKNQKRTSLMILRL
ncbi:2-phosphosulfolactate phosphatase [Priestia megaterium]